MKHVISLTVLFTSIFLMFATVPANAAPAWYGGEVKRIFVYSGGFVITVKSTALNDCKHKYAYFRVNEIGEKGVDRAYSLVLLARSLGEPVSMVIDKDVNGPGGYCFASGSIDMGPKS